MQQQVSSRGKLSFSCILSWRTFLEALGAAGRLGNRGLSF